MKNKLGFLGIVGFLGILGIITEDRTYLAFFAFLVFFRYFFVIPDELFRLNVRRAASPAFFTGVAVQTATIAVNVITKDDSFLIAGLALSFSVSMFLFIILLIIAELKEQKNR
jgi:hypothetical protein